MRPVTFDFDSLSTEFKAFHEAFSPITYGRSMGRAAEHAAYAYDAFTEAEKSLATEWFLELFAQEQAYYGPPYFWVIEKMNDPRFIPLLKTYYKRLKLRHKRPVKTELNGETVMIRPDFSSELKRCKQVIRVLKRRR